MLSIRDVIDIVNTMQAEGIVGRYAVGGAVAAAFYLDPRATEDVDIFVMMQAGPGSLILNVGPIYEYLTKNHNAKISGPYLVLGGWPVQFLAPPEGLEEDAVENAVQVDVEDIKTWVFTAEHISAIALKVGRPKDLARIADFLKEDILDKKVFHELIERFELNDQWESFQKKFQGGVS